MSAEIIPLRDGPSLQDIVGQLRRLADRIEGGEFGEVGSLYALMPVAGDFPTLFGWGDVDGPNDPVIQMELCKHWLIANLVERK